MKLSRVDGPDSPLRNKISSDKQQVLRALKLKELMKLERKKERMVKSILNLLKMFGPVKCHIFKLLTTEISTKNSTNFHEKASTSRNFKFIYVNFQRRRKVDGMNMNIALSQIVTI